MLANKQWVERKALGDRLIQTIEQLLGLEGGGTVAVTVSRPRPRRSLVLAGIGAAACLILAAAWVALGDRPWTRQARVEPAATGPVSPNVPPPPAPPVTQSAAAPLPAVTPSAPPADTAAPPAPPVPPTPAQLAQTPGPAPAPQPPAASPAAAGPAPPAAPADPPPADPPPAQVARLPAESGAQSYGAPALVIRAAAPSDPNGLGKGVHLFRECDQCPVMSVIPAGRSLLGSPELEPGHHASERPQREITIRQPFAVGRSEVSFEEWLACVAEGGCNAHRPGDYGWGYGKRPAINVSWTDAKAYVEWLSRKTGASYRLLSEAEWEYAARACSGTAPCPSQPFWFGKIAPDQANYDWRFAYDGSPKAMPPRRTVPVDETLPNPFGLMHMHGNVREWVEDCWNASLASLPPDGSARTSGDCNSRVVRGGSWADEPKDLRAAKRSWEVPGERRAQIGFRVARSLP
jgi:formylglycine-generating enzyme required for sulfatase activity